MTNTPIAPIEAWAAATLDGEMRFGADPFGARFADEWILAEATGEQFGSLPIFLAGVVGLDPGARRESIELSMVAGAAVHEIRTFGATEQLVRRVWDPLYRFGYGQSDASVHRYWDDEPPFEVGRSRARALVVVRGGEALALVVSLGGAGTTKLHFDGERLGLSESGRCFDDATGRRVEAAGRFTCRFELPENGFRFIVWKAD
jgi:hypothetical protein